jgi:hypothetical protein
MTSSASLWAALVLATAVSSSVVAGDVSNQVTSDDSQPSTETGQITGVLRSLAGALSSGSEAMRQFHGLRSEKEDNKDDLNPAIPGMECYIDRILSYVSCYSPSMGTEKEADTLFRLMVDKLQVALPSNRWIGMKQEPGIDSIRGYLYQDQKSYAHIDMDIVPRLDHEGRNSYMISMFAWTD